MSPEAEERIFDLLAKQGDRMDKANERLTRIEEALKHPAERPCRDLVELRQDHRSLVFSVGDHLSAARDTGRDVKSAAIRAAADILKLAAVAGLGLAIGKGL